jgi:hypothetical protein
MHFANVRSFAISASGTAARAEERAWLMDLVWR